MELEEEGEDNDLSGIDTALKPETVKELGDVTRRLDLEQCRPLYERHVEENRRFTPWDDWKRYADEWPCLLQRAEDVGKGLVIAVFG